MCMSNDEDNGETNGHFIADKETYGVGKRWCALHLPDPCEALRRTCSIPPMGLSHMMRTPRAGQLEPPEHGYIWPLRPEVAGGSVILGHVAEVETPHIV